MIKKRLEVQSYISSFYIVVAIFLLYSADISDCVIYRKKPQSSHLGLFFEESLRSIQQTKQFPVLSS